METKLEIISNFEEYIAPYLLENDFAKRVLALQMFTNPFAKELMHTMLIGNPATGKSTLMEDIAEIAINSGFSGKKITIVGLIEKLHATSGGITCLDEFDKIDKDVRDQLLEVMQSQKISIDQHGFHSRIEARTNVLVGCNPTTNNGILNPEMPAYLQVRFSLPLLTRFHLLIPFYSVDSSLYGDIAISHEIDEEADRKRKMELRDYLMRVREQIPIVDISESMLRKTGDYIKSLQDYSSMRLLISPRTITGFKSCLRARARMNLKNHVEESDFKYVKKIFEELYK